MQLEIGKKYETASGDVIGPMVVNDRGQFTRTHPFMFINMTYTNYGVWDVDSEGGPDDLIKLHTPPLQLEVGVSYNDADGAVVEIERNDGHTTHPFVAVGEARYTPNGHRRWGYPSIVSIHTPEPTPLTLADMPENEARAVFDAWRNGEAIEYFDDMGWNKKDNRQALSAYGYYRIAPVATEFEVLGRRFKTRELAEQAMEIKEVTL